MAAESTEIPDARRRLEEALARLIAGRPTHITLQRRGYRICPSSVCLEAGVTRTTLYKRNRDLLERIEAAASKSGDGGRRRSAHEREVARLRKRVAELEACVTKILSENATLLHRAIHAEETARRHNEMKQNRR